MRLVGILGLAPITLGACGTDVAATGAFRLEPYPPQITLEREAKQPSPSAPKPEALSATPASGSRFEFPPEQSRLAVAPGRWAIRVPLPRNQTVTLGVSGPARALRQFELLGRGALRHVATVRGDGQLPAFVSFSTDSEPEPLLVVIDADAPVTLHRIAVSPLDAVAARRRGQATTRVALPLVGMRPPSSAKAGYVFATAPRYAFLRADAAEALRGALRQVKRRIGREPIALGDASQWNGDRPATDQHLARHISHQGGRDVDVGLPGLDGDSSLRHRCTLTLAPPDRATCAEGSVSGFDGERLAYLLALLIEGPTSGNRFIADPKKREGALAPVELVFADAELIAAVRAALPELRKKKWIHDEAVTTLGEDTFLRASPWHTDHVHVRFAGEPATVPEALRAIVATP